MGFGFMSEELMSVASIAGTWQGLCSVDGQDNTSDPRDDWWDGRMIPFSANGAGDSMVVDSVGRDVARPTTRA